MDDDELTRARRALRGVDPELDLTQVYAESRARAREAAGARDAAAVDAAHDGWSDAEGVEILLRDAGSQTLPVRPARRRPALVWGLAAAAAGVLTVSLAGTPVLRALPGSAPATSTSPDHSTDAPMPSPTVGLTPAEVIDRTVLAMAGDGCRVQTRSTLGDETLARFDDVQAENDETPKPAQLDQVPLQVLQEAAVRTMFGLSPDEGTDGRLHDDLGIEELGGQAVIRIRATPADTAVLGGDVTRVDLLVDPATWLPRAGETSAESDQAQRYVVHSEFTWTGCARPSSSPTLNPEAPLGSG